ncbi:MAG: tRNA guanosine(34) transglycosylase Tgt [Anaerolineaceae bacterium]|nr:tRNA guanosine(34) transglycosylase Tgt [Anaerolineaceae bacterium]
MQPPRRASLSLAHGQICFPVYIPDATFGVVRAVDAADLSACGVSALMMNTFHLMQRPGSTTVQALGGLHKMSGWSNPIFTDSGGFQAYSLIRQDPRLGSITDRGLLFRPQASDRKLQLTPEKSVQLQMSYGSDVVISLDDCTHVDETEAEQEAAVARTIAWARRGKGEYLRLAEQKGLSDAQRPRLFAVIQGGRSRALRQRCAEALLETGFDGFGYGGWPLDREGRLLVDILAYLRELVPLEFPLHALGVGHPRNVLTGYDLGYDLFDSAMPTRDARHARLYTFTQPAEGSAAGLSGDWFDYLYLQDERHIRASVPLSPYCDGLCCQRYSRGYLHHLFKLNDSLFLRLATLHNLRFMVQLTERIRMRQI